MVLPWAGNYLHLSIGQSLHRFILEVFENTLKYAKKLESVGFSREQAEMTIGILSEVVESSLATKQDMKDVRLEMKNEMSLLRYEMNQIKSELIIKLGATIVSATVFSTGAISLVIAYMQ